MHIIYSTKYEIELEHHPWHTVKYRLAVDNLRSQGILNHLKIVDAPMADDSDILRVHTFEYWLKLYSLNFSDEEISHAEIPLTSETVDFFWRMAGGTILASEQALIDGICVHLGGGFHHAYQSHASGFCLLNDIAIGLRVLLDREAIHSAVVIDCDLHQGDATARIFSDDTRVFTLSLHQKDAFPYYKQRSSLDIELPAGTGDEEYLAVLDEALASLFADGRQFDFLHYQAGVDTYTNDQLGRLQLSEEGLRERDRRIITTALDRGIPTVVTFGGGYTTDPAEVARLHANTVVEAFRALAAKREESARI